MQCSPQAKFKVYHSQGTTVGLWMKTVATSKLLESPYSHIKGKFRTEGLLGRYALGMLGRTLYCTRRNFHQEKSFHIIIIRS